MQNFPMKMIQLIAPIVERQAIMLIIAKDGTLKKRSEQRILGKGKEVINVEKEVINVEELPGNDKNDKEQEEVQSNVKTPDKNTSPAELLKAQDLQIEVEIKANIQVNYVGDLDVNAQDDTSTQGSFVDATQDHNEEDEDEKQITQPLSTPDIVQKDIDFLKNSWANIVENKDADTRFLQTLEKFLKQTPYKSLIVMVFR